MLVIILVEMLSTLWCGAVCCWLNCRCTYGVVLFGVLRCADFGSDLVLVLACGVSDAPLKAAWLWALLADWDARFQMQLAALLCNTSPVGSKC